MTPVAWASASVEDVLDDRPAHVVPETEHHRDRYGEHGAEGCVRAVDASRWNWLWSTPIPWLRPHA